MANIYLKKPSCGSRIIGTSLISHYDLFCQRFSLEQIMKRATRTTCSSFTLMDYVLSNSRENISQDGVIEIDISDQQLIYLSQKLHRMKMNTHKQIKIRSLRKVFTWSTFLIIWSTSHDQINNADIVYSDFIQRITPGINKIAPLKEIWSKNFQRLV